MKRVLLRARNEIEALRQENKILRAKVDTIEIFASALNMRPNNQSMTMSEDIVGSIERAIDELEKTPSKQPELTTKK